MKTRDLYYPQLIIYGAFFVILFAASFRCTPDDPTPPPKNNISICGRDAFPDLTVSAEVKKSDDMIITAKNIGPCDNNTTTLLTVYHTNAEDENYLTSRYNLPGIFYRPPDYWVDEWPVKTDTLIFIPALKSGENKQFKIYGRGIYGKIIKNYVAYLICIDPIIFIREEDKYNNALLFPENRFISL